MNVTIVIVESMLVWYTHYDESKKKKKVVVSVQHKLQVMQSLDKGEILRIIRPIMELKRTLWAIVVGIALIWNDSRLMHVVQ